jgi:hypothetical protein
MTNKTVFLLNFSVCFLMTMFGALLFSNDTGLFLMLLGLACANALMFIVVSLSDDNS